MIFPVISRIFAKLSGIINFWTCCTVVFTFIITVMAVSYFQTGENFSYAPEVFKNPPPAAVQPRQMEEKVEVKDTISFEYTPPEGEEPKKRYPQALIIGFPKCGTRALINYLALHPYVVIHPSEVHFYDLDEVFSKGYKWYLDEMPPSYSDQITMEKTPAYVRSERAVTELKRKFPKIKVIALVRDPIDRVLSQDAQLEQKSDHTSKADIVDRLVYKNGSLHAGNSILGMGEYYIMLLKWFKAFPRDQILVLNGDELTANPLKVTKEVEKFLGLPPLYTKKNFYFDEGKGFYCPVTFGPVQKVLCLGEGKGRPHRELPERYEKALYNYYSPLNEKLFDLLGERFNWTSHKK